MAQIFVELKLAAENFNSGLKTSQDEIKKFEKVIAPSTKALADFGSAMTSMGKVLTVGLTAPIAVIAGLGVAFNAMQEQAQTAFTTMLGSGEKAQVFLEGLKDFAAKTPFEFPDLVRAAQRLMAMGFAADEVRPLLTTVGDAVAGLGGGAAEIDRVTLALGQMAGRGKVATQEMNQLTEVGIPAWKLLAEGMGVTETALRDMVEKGAVPAKAAIDILMDGMTEKFGGMSAKQAETFNGLISTIKDESRFLAGEITEGLFNVLKGPAKAVADSLHVVREATAGWSSESKAAIAVVAGLAAAAGPLLLVAGTLATSLSNLIKIVPGLVASFSTFTTAIGLGAASLTGIAEVVGIVAAALATLYVAKQVSDWAGWTPKIVEASSELWETAKATTSFVAELGKIAWSELKSQFVSFTEATKGLRQLLGETSKELGDLTGLSMGDLWDSFKKSTLTLLGPLGYVIEHLHEAKEAMKRFTDEGAPDVLQPMTVAQTMFSGQLSKSAEAALLAATGVTKYATEQKASMAATMAAAAAAVEHQKVIDGILKSFGKEQDEARNTVEALKILESRHVSSAEITRVMGKSIEGLRDSLVAAGLPIPPLLDKYAALNELSKALQTSTKVYDDALKANAASAQTATLIMSNYGDKLLLVPNWTTDAATGVTTMTLSLKNSGMIAQETRDHWVNAMTSIKEPAADAVVGIAGIAAAHENAAGRAMAAADLTNQAINSTNKISDEAAKASGKHANEVGVAWETAMANLSTQIGKSLADMIFSADFSLKTLTDLATETAKGMLGAFLSGLISPLTDAVGKMGRDLASDLFGGGGSSAGGIFGGISKKISGLFGGGGGALGMDESLGLLGGGGGGAGGLGAAMTGFLTNPFTIAAGAAIGVGILWAKSQAHHEANTWVQQFQNPFDSMMNQINASGGTPQDMQMLRSAAVADYMTATQEFATHGSDEKTVAKQAYDTFLKYYGSPSQYSVPIPSLSVGDPFIKRQGLYELHRGERVVTAAENRNWAARKGMVGDVGGNTIINNSFTFGDIKADDPVGFASRVREVVDKAFRFNSDGFRKVLART